MDSIIEMNCASGNYCVPWKIMKIIGYYEVGVGCEGGREKNGRNGMKEGVCVCVCERERERWEEKEMNGIKAHDSVL